MEEDEEGTLCYIPWLSSAFPFSSNINHVSQELRAEIMESLPQPGEAEELAAFYFQYAAWMLVNPVFRPLQVAGANHEMLPRYTPILEQDFKEQIFPLVYEDASTTERGSAEAHKLALLFFVFAMGTLTNPRTRDISTQDAMKYFHIGRAALMLNQSLETPSVPLLQGLLLMCHFMFLANIESSRWLAMGIIVKLSQSVGFI